MSGRASAPAAWFFAAGALALGGIVVAAALILHFFSTHEAPTRFLAPGTQSVEIKRPGRTIVWHEHRTLFDGRSFDLPPGLPHGVRLEVTAPDGARVATEPTAVTLKWGRVERAAVVAFDAAAAGRYAVAARGDAQPFVLAVGADFTWPLVRAIGGAIAAVVIGLGAGLALGLYALLRRAPAAAAVSAANGADDKRLRDLTAVVYALQALSLVFGLTLIAGVIVNYLKRPDVAGTWLESHFDWQIRTFWWLLLWGVVGLASAVVFVGLLVLLCAAVWFVYRVVRGWIALIDRRPIGLQ
jgi:uncharacterized membrane protein